MSGAAAEHIREAIPVLASYCDALGFAAFAEGKNLESDLQRDSIRMIDASVRQAADQFGIGDESSLPGAGGLAHHGRARDTKPRKVRPELGLSPEGIALGRTRCHLAHGRHARHGSCRGAARRLRAAVQDHGQGALGGVGRGRWFADRDH